MEPQLRVLVPLAHAVPLGVLPLTVLLQPLVSWDNETPGVCVCLPEPHAAPVCALLLAMEQTGPGAGEETPKGPRRGL